jgi:glycosyltransferase involved in cell wall biosynthesis
MRERVIRIPVASHEELVDLLGAARLCAVPSLYEGFGLTVLEAMACGTPVVCSRAASLPEVTGDAALMVDATSEEELRDGIRRVLQDGALARELRARGSVRARELGWDRAARELRALYDRVA